LLGLKRARLAIYGQFQKSVAIPSSGIL